jgi:hypothetical protein
LSVAVKRKQQRLKRQFWLLRAYNTSPVCACRQGVLH